MAFVGRLPETKVQEGVPASAFVVRQTPPPAAPTQSRHFDCEQLGSRASAVMRPDVV